jgi:type IV pilus assembly protein PilE
VRLKFDKSSGFTLVELMIVVAIIAILLLLLLPAYQNQVLKAKRSLGRGELLSVMARQEQYFVNNRQYATDLSDLGYAANGYFIDEEGNDTGAAGAGVIYKIQLAAAPVPTATVYSLEAVPQSRQANDNNCGTLTITHTGVKSAQGGAFDCW